MRPSRGSHESTKQRSPSRVPSRTGRQTSVTGSHQAPSSHGAARPHVSPTRAGRRQTPRNSSPSRAQTVPSSHGRSTSGSLSCQRPQASPSPAGAARTKRAHQLGSPGRQKRGSPSTGAQSSSRAHSPATGTQTFRPSTQLDGARRHAWFGAHSRLHAHSSPAATTPRRYRPSQPGNVRESETMSPRSTTSARSIARRHASTSSLPNRTNVLAIHRADSTTQTSRDTRSISRAGQSARGSSAMRPQYASASCASASSRSSSVGSCELGHAVTSKKRRATPRGRRARFMTVGEWRPARILGSRIPRDSAKIRGRRSLGEARQPFVARRGVRRRQRRKRSESCIDDRTSPSTGGPRGTG